LSKEWEFSVNTMEVQGSDFLERQVKGYDTLPADIRRPCPLDQDALADHFQEMQVHYGRPVSARQAIEAAQLACRPATHDFDPRVLIALAGDMVVGSIVMNVTFPAFELTKSLYIRDLYVRSTARRAGVGRRLMTAAARLAIIEGFSALDWTTDTRNVDARRMYEACGGRQVERTYYRMADSVLALCADD
jgi:GNAT superfamily N-acetyltransferase